MNFIHIPVEVSKKMIELKAVEQKICNEMRRVKKMLEIFIFPLIAPPQIDIKLIPKLDSIVH